MSQQRTPGTSSTDDDYFTIPSLALPTTRRNRVSAQMPSTVSTGPMSSDPFSVFPCEEDQEFKMDDTVREELERHEWWHDNVPQEDVDLMLTNEGDFLLRKTGPKAQPIVSCKYRGNTINIMICRKEVNGVVLYSINDVKDFPSIIEAAMFHFKSGVAIYAGCKLVRPIVKQAWELCRNDVILAEKIGEGAFGEIYSGELVIKKATHDQPEIKVPVAIKLVHAAHITETKKEALIKMQEEARFMRQYNHQNLVRLHGVLFSNNESMIVMELVRGGSLDKYLQRNELPIRTKCSYAFDISAGLAFLHAHTCLHRDIAARNCLVTEDGKIAKLSDFGQSYRGIQYNIPTTERIPVRWSPPEVIQRGFCVKESDVWSYGVLLWEIFNDGKLPHDGLDTRYIRDNVETLRLTDIPEPELNTVMKSCWDNNYQNRPQMLQIAKRLKKFATHEVVVEKVNVKPPRERAKERLEQKAKQKKTTGEKSRMPSVNNRLTLKGDERKGKKKVVKSKSLDGSEERGKGGKKKKAAEKSRMKKP